MENTETQIWLDFALAHNYISKEVYNDFIECSKEIGKMLNYMINNPEKYQRKTKL
jgi:four helix bundle protein